MTQRWRQGPAEGVEECERQPTRDGVGGRRHMKQAELDYRYQLVTTDTLKLLVEEDRQER